MVTVDAFGHIPLAELNHAADGVCHSRGWHSLECQRAQDVAFGFGAAVVGVLLIAGIAALFSDS